MAVAGESDVIGDLGNVVPAEQASKRGAQPDFQLILVEGHVLGPRKHLRQEAWRLPNLR
jgi:hypothetical protein